MKPQDKQLSRNFLLSEFTCQCGCGKDFISPKLVGILQDLRDFFQEPIRVLSGVRCKEHNKHIGVENSRHLLGIAADITISSIKPIYIFDWFAVEFPQCHGIGLYHNRVHFDIRAVRARWAVWEDSSDDR